MANKRKRTYSNRSTNKRNKKRMSNKSVRSRAKKLGDGKKESKWTDSGNVKAKARKKHATYKQNGKGKFPIFDRKSAMSALRLRGHAPKSQRDDIIRRAAKYAPEAAKKARKQDKKKS